jgi:hypothetical protein
LADREGCCIALDFRKYLGGEKRITEYCHNLAVDGGRKAAEILGTEMVETKDGELTANMVRSLEGSCRRGPVANAKASQVNVRLPFLPSVSEDKIKEKEELRRQYEYLLDRMFRAKVFAAVVSNAR